jgi:hypothetical protein
MIITARKGAGASGGKSGRKGEGGSAVYTMLFIAYVAGLHHQLRQ